MKFPDWFHVLTALSLIGLLLRLSPKIAKSFPKKVVHRKNFPALLVAPKSNADGSPGGVAGGRY
jgi:hypothetical protein